VSVAGDAINKRRMSMRRESARSLIIPKERMASTFFISIKFFLIRESKTKHMICKADFTAAGIDAFSSGELL
jgi:hypothetical protein